MPMARGRIDGLDKPVSRLVLGCGWFRPDDERVNPLLEAFLAAGGTALDTAYAYGRGESERTLGRWLRAHGRRDDVVLITKGALHASDWSPRVTPEVITAELTESLERLQTDHIDLYLLHRDDPDVPVGPIVDCLNEHVRAGRIRVFGGSNWSARRFDEAAAYARGHGIQGFAASSPHFALAVAHDPPHMGHAMVSDDPEALAWYRARQMPLLSWTSQARGFFSAAIDPGVEADRRRFARFDHEDNWERRRRCLALAERRGIPSTQVALAWLLAQTPDIYPIIGPSRVPHLEDAVAALDVALSPGERAWLNLQADRLP